MSESPVESRVKPRGSEKLSELTLIVRPPGRPAEIRTFTDAQRGEAERYATDTGATVEPLL